MVTIALLASGYGRHLRTFKGLTKSVFWVSIHPPLRDLLVQRPDAEIIRCIFLVVVVSILL